MGIRCWIAFLAVVSSVGCQTVEPESFMYWRKSAISVRVATPAEVERIGRQARLELDSLDLRAIYEPLLASTFPAGSFDVEEFRNDNLIGSDWHSPYWDLEGKLIRARLSVAMGNDWLSNGDLMVEAILSGFAGSNQLVKNLAARIVNEVVERLAALMIDTAEAAGKRATVVELEGAGP